MNITKKITSSFPWVVAIAVLTVTFLAPVQDALAKDALEYFAEQREYFDGILPSTSPLDIVLNIIKIFLQLVGLIAFILILYGGFTWMTSAGNEEKVKKGRDILLWSFIGLVVILSSLGILIYLDAQLAVITGTATTTP